MKILPKIQFTKETFFVLAFAAAICLGDFIAFPFGALRISAQDLIVILTGICLGFPQSGAAVGIFLVLGAVGLPVFPDGNAGTAYLFYSDNAGYLMGYFFAASISGFIVRRPNETKIPLQKILFASAIGMIVLYVFGINHLKRMQNRTLLETLMTEISPRLRFDAIKVLIITGVSVFLRPVFAKQLDNK